MDDVEVYGGKNEDDKVMIPDHLLQEINQNWLQLLLAIKEEQKKTSANQILETGHQHPQEDR